MQVHLSSASRLPKNPCPAIYCCGVLQQLNEGLVQVAQGRGMSGFHSDPRVQSDPKAGPCAFFQGGWPIHGTSARETELPGLWNAIH